MHGKAHRKHPFKNSTIQGSEQYLPTLEQTEVNAACKIM